jgi:hypothetical protein
MFRISRRNRKTALRLFVIAPRLASRLGTFRLDGGKSGCMTRSLVCIFVRASLSSKVSIGILSSVKGRSKLYRPPKFQATSYSSQYSPRHPPYSNHVYCTLQDPLPLPYIACHIATRYVPARMLFLGLLMDGTIMSNHSDFSQLSIATS